jgi:hypothetical protein
VGARRRYFCDSGVICVLEPLRILKYAPILRAQMPCNGVILVEAIYTRFLLAPVRRIW